MNRGETLLGLLGEGIGTGESQEQLQAVVGSTWRTGEPQDESVQITVMEAIYHKKCAFKKNSVLQTF